MSTSHPLLSIVIPVYNEQGNIHELLARLLPIAQAYSYELIFVDDGSSDFTVAEISHHATQNHHIKLISLTRNFGHQLALSAGYAHSSGDAIISIDADLQDPPELIHAMIKKWQDGAKIVYAKRRSRTSDTSFKKYTAHLFYWCINRLSDTSIPQDVGDYRLIDRSVANYLNTLPESARFLRGLVAWSGYPAEYVEFDRAARHAGDTHYPFRKMLAFATTGITSFSIKPLRLVTYLGFITAGIGFSGIAYALCRRLFLPHEYWVTGWTTIFVAIMFFSGIQILFLGIIGEYIGRIFVQVQGRPLYLIKHTVNFPLTPRLPHS
jgi:dolichol-phosphate mannosyltransferase